MGMLDPAPEFIIDDIEQRFIPPSYEPYYYEGKLYAYPTQFNPTAVIANVDLFNEMGLPDPDDLLVYWTDLEDLQKRMTRYDSEGNLLTIGLSLCYRGEWGKHHFSPFLWACGADYLDENNMPAFNNSAGVKVLQLFGKLVVPGYSGDWRKGGVGVNLHSCQVRREIREMDSPVTLRPLAQALKAEDGQPVTSFWSWPMVVHRNTKDRRKAWELARCLQSEESWKQFSSQMSYMATTFESIDHMMTVDASWFGPFVNWLKATRPSPKIPDWAGIVDRAILQQVEQYIRGNIDPRTALINAEERLLAELRELENY